MQPREGREIAQGWPRDGRERAERERQGGAALAGRNSDSSVSVVSCKSMWHLGRVVATRRVTHSMPPNNRRWSAGRAAPENDNHHQPSLGVATRPTLGRATWRTGIGRPCLRAPRGAREGPQTPPWPPEGRGRLSKKAARLSISFVGARPPEGRGRRGVSRLRCPGLRGRLLDWPPRGANVSGVSHEQ